MAYGFVSESLRREHRQALVVAGSERRLARELVVQALVQLRGHEHTQERAE